MFSKKILGLVGLLFIGSQVSAASIPKCGDILKDIENPCGTIDSGEYCFDDSENKIYYHESTCKLVADGAFVVNSDDGSIVDTITAGNSFRMHYCNGSSCVATKGYVKNGDVVSGIKYFLINEEGAKQITPTSVKLDTACTEHVGELISVETKDGDSEVSLCLTKSKSVKLDGIEGDSYLAFNLGALELDAKKDDNTKVVITKKPNVLLVNTLYKTDGEPHCYDDSDASIMPRIDNFCEGENCDKYYVCTNGVCTLQTSSCPRGDNGIRDDANETGSGTPPPTCDPTKEEDNNCAEGYYLYSEGLKVKDKEEGTLYHCEKEVATGAKKRTETGSIKCTDVKQIPTGYFKNTAYDSGKAELDDAQYIKCTSTAGTVTCEAITVDGETCNDGLVYKDGENIMLCLDSGRSISIQLTGYNANDKDYFIKVSGTGNIFGSGDNYTLVTVNKESVVKSSNSDTALYKYAGNNYEVLERSAGVCNYNGKLYEFGLICSNEVGYDSSTVYYIFKDYKEVTEVTEVTEA